MGTPTLTLSRHVLSSDGIPPETSRDLAVLLAQVSLASKIIAREVNRAALVGRLGSAGKVSFQGEEVKKLDLWSHDTLVQALKESGLVCTLVSEEREEPLHFARHCPHARYTACFDPIDGSSNLDVNGTAGTIFSIRPRSHVGADHIRADVLQKGTEQVAAGYVMYGPSTVLVYTAGKGVHGFTLDSTLGEFFLSHENIRVPPKGNTYSVNEGYYHRWHPHTRRALEYLREPDLKSGRPYSLRYIGSLVADFHRILLEGGVFLYPADARSPKQPTGKLRLLYEAAPMGYIVEQAGGRASTGTQRILDIRPSSYHQRVPLIIGSQKDVSLIEDFYQSRR